MINGLSWMKSFASLQVIRSVLMIASFFGMWAADWDAQRLPLALTIAELGVLPVAAIMLARGRYFRGATGDIWAWSRQHLSFGLRSFGAAALTALNNWIDVLMLGHFSGDDVVGLYGLPATLTAGFYQVLVVLRNNYNPRLVAAYESGDLPGLESMIHRGKRVTYLVIGAAALLLLNAYPMAAAALDHKGTFMAGWPILAFLLAGIVAVAGYVPFSHVLMLARRPGIQTWTIVLTLTLKIAGNWVLIPVLSATGAALVTAACYVFNAALMIYLTRRLIHVRL